MDQQQDTPQSQQSQNQTPKQQVVEALKGATNVLVTVSNNPSVDQLAACIGLTLMLNKLDKHATAVFSGQVPSTLEFLQPEKTIETNTDSLRDFIISLDRAKADKLRYKVEDNVVNIFITPYRTSISGDDLKFSQGDFNVDVVMALGVDNRDHLDEAITSHGRILHDATVIGMSCGSNSSDVGAINWHEDAASSLSEMLVSISESFQSGLLDGQMATSFLTGIVSETERFSNDRTTPKVMTMSAQLMAAGANQQLISSQLAPAPAWEPPKEEPKTDPEQPVEQPEPEKPVEVYVPPEEVLEKLPNPVPMTPPKEEKEEFDIPKEGEQGDDISNLISLQEEITAQAEENEQPAEEEPKTEPEQPVEETSSEPGPAVQLDMSTSKDKDTVNEIHIDENGHVHDAASDAIDSAREATMKHERVIQPLSDQQPKEETPKTDLSSYIFEPPANGGTFTGSTQDDPTKEASVNPLTETQEEMPMLSHEHSTMGNEEVLSASGDDFLAPSIENAIDPSAASAADRPSDTVDPLAGMTPPVVTNLEPEATPPALPEIPAPSSDPMTATPADQDAARQAVMSAVESETPFAPSPIAALNANPIALDAPMMNPGDTSTPTPPPVPPPMMMPPQGPGSPTLPAPVEEDEKKDEPTNPFNLPPVQ